MIVTELRQSFPLSGLLKVAGLSRSTFYYQMKAEGTEHRHATLKRTIQRVYNEHKGRYGYRRVTAAIRRTGTLVNHKSVQRRMNEMDLRSIARVKKYRAFRGEQNLFAPNLLNRKFKASKPNEKWVTDVTQFRINGEKLYLSPIVDLFNGEVISYEASRRPLFPMIDAMLRKAFARLGKSDAPLLHSDQGWQYTMPVYRQLLVENRLTISMSRKGNCYDNAPAESFFGALKAEFFYPGKFVSIEALQRGLGAYIDYYNNKRIKLGLGGMSPVEYRQQRSVV